MKKVKYITGFIAVFLIIMAPFVGIYANEELTEHATNVIALVYVAILVVNLIIFAIIHTNEN